MNLEDLLNKYKQKKIKETNDFFKKTLYDYNNLELIKKKYFNEFYGLKNGFHFMDSFLKELKINTPIQKSNNRLNDYQDGKVIIYDYTEKLFMVYPNSVVEDVFLKIYVEQYFDLDKNKLYIALFQAMSKAKKDLGLNLVPNFMELANVVNWFLSVLRDQNNENYQNYFSFKITIEAIPGVFFENSLEDHHKLIKNFLDILIEEKIISQNGTFYEFLDIENSIKLIYGNFDLFWFNRPEKEFILKTNFEFDDSIFIELSNDDIDYSNDFFISENKFAKKIKTNNILFSYVLNSMFSHVALHTYTFTNSLYSDFLMKKNITFF